MRMLVTSGCPSVIRIVWFLAACLMASPVWSGPGISQSSARGNQYFATVHLSGGDIGAEVTLTFENPVELDSTSLDVSAELVDPRGPELADRLPAGFFLPARFPVLMSIAATVQDQPAQKREAKTAKKKAGQPLQPKRIIEFTTNEGAWISLDVSRDGETILFELLGDLYTVPMGGGIRRRHHPWHGL